MRLLSLVLAGMLALGGCSSFFVGNKSVENVRVMVSDNGADNDVRKVTVSNTKRIYKDSDLDASSDDLVLNAIVEDGAGGELVGFGKISPVTVTASHKNIAERNGRIRLSFDVQVPPSILDDKRQVRIVPRLFMEKDSMMMDRLFITGKDYRDAQEKGYERYNKYFASIIPDSVDFLKAFGYLGLLQYFTQRNLEDRIRGEFGVTEPEAIEYYIRHYLVRLNQRRKERLEDVFRKCVKDPIDRLGVRLDTVLRDPSGGLVYRYVQELPARSGMHRLRLVFNGSVHNYGRKLFSFSSPDTLAYYVSSLVQLADTSAIYREHTLARDVSASTVSYIEFEKGSWEIDTLLGNNQEELQRIRADLDSLAVDPAFAADSVLVEASCSPEGRYEFNRNLSRKRAESITEYFSAIYKKKDSDVEFRYTYVPENWDLLKELVLSDSLIVNRNEVLSVFDENDCDRREHLLSGCVDYRHICSSIYPKLRRIVFRFFLHRRIYDKVLSRIEVDASYMQGLEALQERDFKKALNLLRPYSDLNTAIACLCLDYNSAALNILSRQKDSPTVRYLKALCYIRLGNRAKASQYFTSAVSEDGRLRFRAALDPEMECLLDETE